MTGVGDSEDSADIDPAVLARAEAALARLQDDYPNWINADLARARALTITADDDSRARLYTIIHDIKGQAGTFGYPLVGELASRLCRQLQDGPPDPKRICAMLDAMTAIIDQRLSENGGAVGQRILSGLD